MFGERIAPFLNRAFTGWNVNRSFWLWIVRYTPQPDLERTNVLFRYFHSCFTLSDDARVEFDRQSEVNSFINGWLCYLHSASQRAVFQLEIISLNIVYFKCLSDRAGQEWLQFYRCDCGLADFCFEQDCSNILVGNSCQFYWVAEFS